MVKRELTVKANSPRTPAVGSTAQAATQASVQPESSSLFRITAHLRVAGR
jgi:hypothetical protein